MYFLRKSIVFFVYSAAILGRTCIGSLSHWRFGKCSICYGKKVFEETIQHVSDYGICCIATPRPGYIFSITALPERRKCPMRMDVLLLAISMALFALSGGSPGSVSAEGSGEQEFRCKPTKPDQLGPMYEPNAPVRTSVGKGYLLEGVVKSARDCSPIPGARIEFWLVNLQGNYDDDHRATVPVNSSGGYSFESNFPKSYGGRPAHIHLCVTAPGYETLVTQHYPKAGDTRMTYDLVLVPVKGSRS